MITPLTSAVMRLRLFVKTKGQKENMCSTTSLALNELDVILI